MTYSDRLLSACIGCMIGYMIGCTKENPRFQPDDGQDLAMAFDLAAPRDATVDGANRPPLTWVHVQRGTFIMGTSASDLGADPDEMPAFTVTVAAFDATRTEITLGQYKACMTAGACTAPDPFVAGNNPREYCNYVPGAFDASAARDNDPVNCVDFAQAAAFCDFVGGRLPTEREWEYAARGPADSVFPWGNELPQNQLCWNRSGTCPVATHEITLFGTYFAQGLADLGGNVSEWINDSYCVYPNGTQCDTTKRLIRGGAWDVNVMQWVRAAYRDQRDPTTRVPHIGFRCARSSA